jgi:hypothetical protein
MMPVTDEQEATLHAQLAGRFGEHERLLAALDPDAARTGYSALVTTAFALAADMRFPRGGSPADVITYVGDVRSRAESVSARLDPHAAEQVLLAYLTDEEIGDIDARTRFQTRHLLLAALIADANLDAEGLDSFMARARRLADQWLTRPRLEGSGRRHPGCVPGLPAGA